MVMLTGSGAVLVLREVLLALGASPFAMHVTTACRADSLLLGGALAMLYRSRLWRKVQRFAPLGFIVAAAIIVVSLAVLEPLMVIKDLNVSFGRRAWNTQY
jgi:peptidoglycan/LPS O-acetylase OafA/YrhL